MKQCPFCAEDIQDAAVVCKHCNRELSEHQKDTISCPFCNASVSRGSRICPACGDDVSGVRGNAAHLTGSKSSPTISKGIVTIQGRAFAINHIVSISDVRSRKDRRPLWNVVAGIEAALLLLCVWVFSGDQRFVEFRESNRLLVDSMVFLLILCASVLLFVGLPLGFIFCSPQSRFIINFGTWQAQQIVKGEHEDEIQSLHDELVRSLSR
jgi:hypothetical protein